LRSSAPIGISFRGGRSGVMRLQKADWKSKRSKYLIPGHQNESILSARRHPGLVILPPPF